MAGNPTIGVRSQSVTQTIDNCPENLTGGSLEFYLWEEKTGSFSPALHRENRCKNLIGGGDMTSKARHTCHLKREWGKGPTLHAGQIGAPMRPLKVIFLH